MQQEKRGTERATRAIIDLGAISHNVAAIRKKIGGQRGLMAVVKADGYGHGAVEVSRTALRNGADSLAVALPEEGQHLREAGIEAPILVLGLIQPEEAWKVVDSQLDQTVSSIALLEALDREAASASTQVNIHVKVETGLGRIGVEPHEVVLFLRRARSYRNLKVAGLFSHFSAADERDKTFSQHQLQLFEQTIREIRHAGIELPQRHMANSAATLDLPESYYDLVRPGLIIYGLYPSTEVSHSIEVKPAMTLKTKVCYLKTVPQGTPISYGRTFVTQKQTRVATLPLGYGDGYKRALANKGEVLIKGRRAPVIGRICMDMCMIDVSDVPDVQAGDEAIVFGQEPTADELAAKIGTINYEVVTTVGKRVPRVYVNS